jgi:hypothetical protein
METTVLKEESTILKMKDIALDITWSKIASRYFGKSPSWIYNKMKGIDGNGGPGGFTYEEKSQLKAALYDFAERIRKVADSID